VQPEWGGTGEGRLTEALEFDQTESYSCGSLNWRSMMLTLKATVSWRKTLHRCSCHRNHPWVLEEGLIFVDRPNHSLEGLVSCPRPRTRLRQTDYLERSFQSLIVKNPRGRRGGLFSFSEYWAGKIDIKRCDE